MKEKGYADDRLINDVLKRTERKEFTNTLYYLAADLIKEGNYSNIEIYQMFKYSADKSKEQIQKRLNEKLEQIQEKLKELIK